MDNNETKTIINTPEFILKLQHGDKDALEILLVYMKPILTKIAMRYRYFFPNIDLETLISEGTYGLLKGIKHYNYNKNVKLESYLRLWISKYIQKYITENFTLLRIPTYLLKRIKKVLQLLRKESTEEQIVKQLKISKIQVKSLVTEELKKLSQFSFDRYIDRNEEQETFYDVTEDINEEPLDKGLITGHLKNTIENLLNQLDYEEAEVIRYRFGLKEYRHFTLKEIARRLNISPQKVKQLEQKALVKMRQILEKGE